MWRQRGLDFWVEWTPLSLAMAVIALERGGGMTHWVAPTEISTILPFIICYEHIFVDLMYTIHVVRMPAMSTGSLAPDSPLTCTSALFLCRIAYVLPGFVKNTSLLNLDSPQASGILWTRLELPLSSS